MFKLSDCYWHRQCLQYHELVGWWYVPGLTARLQLGKNGFYNIRTNSIGMRADREFSPAKPRDRKRIVLLGDSYTAGDGVSNGERYSDLLEQRFPGLEVLNFGLPGSGTDQQLLIFENIAREFSTDLYVFAPLVENILRNAQSCRPLLDLAGGSVVYRAKPFFDFDEAGDLVLHHQPVPNESRPEHALGDWSWDIPGSAEAPNEVFGQYRDESHRLWRLMKALLERFLAGVPGAPVVILPLPTYHFFLGNQEPSYLERFRTLEDRRRGRFVVDVLPSFRRLEDRERERCIFGSSDPHYTRLAHRVVAAALAEQLEELCPELVGAIAP